MLEPILKNRNFLKRSEVSPLSGIHKHFVQTYVMRFEEINLENVVFFLIFQSLSILNWKMYLKKIKTSGDIVKRLTLCFTKSNKTYSTYYLKTITAESYFLYMLSYQMNFKLKILKIFMDLKCLLKNVSFFR